MVREVKSSGGGRVGLDVGVCGWWWGELGLDADGFAPAGRLDYSDAPGDDCSVCNELFVFNNNGLVWPCGDLGESGGPVGEKVAE